MLPTAHLHLGPGQNRLDRHLPSLPGLGIIALRGDYSLTSGRQPLVVTDAGPAHPVLGRGLQDTGSACKGGGRRVRVKVSLMGELAKYGGLRAVYVDLADNSDVKGLLAKLDSHTSKPVLPVLVQPNDLISSHYSIMLNGSNVLLAKALYTPLSDGDEVTVVPKVAGGES